MILLPNREQMYLLFLLTFPLIIYSNTFQSSFHFDDYVYILGDPGIGDIQGKFLSLGKNIFLPDRRLVALSFAINHALHGFELPGYHLINILIHGINGCLLLLILQLLLINGVSKRAEKITTSTKLVVFCISLIFLAHPLAVNSVTYLSQRHVLLTTSFYLSGFLFYLKSLEQMNMRWVWLHRVLCVFCFWGGIHCKPMALTLPFVLFAYEVVRFSGKKDFERTDSYRIIKFALFVTAFFSIIAIYAHDAGLFSKKEAVAGFHSSNLWTPWVHFLTESTVFVNYLKLIFLPLPQWMCVDHAYPLATSIDSRVVFSCGLQSLIFYGGVWAFRHGMRIAAFGVAWFYLTISPPYLILPIADVMVEYKTYLPSIGIYMAVAEIGCMLSQRWSSKKIAAILVTMVVAASIGTFQRNRVFATEITFWTDSISKYPSAPRPYNNRGLAWHAKGDYSRAITDFERVLQLDPANLLVYANLGDSYKAMNDINSALRFYTEYIKRQPGKADGYVRLGNVMAIQGDWQGAVGQYQQAVKLELKNQDALYNLGLGLGRIGKGKEMAGVFKMIIKMNPNHSMARNGLGVFNYNNGDREKAIRYFTKALQIDPKNADALFNLAICYLETGDWPNAFKLSDRLLKIDPKRGALLKEQFQKNAVSNQIHEQ